MRTDFSEFSFGYSLTEEFMSAFRPRMNAAPIFPSLIQEGRSGGGYDVRFDLPGLPVMIQFKRPDVMTTARATEICDYSLDLQPPFYRMHIRSHATSQQHDLLLEHDNGTNLVFYATPCFHDIGTFNRHYIERQIIDNTLFVRPQSIGFLTKEPHHFAYDGNDLAYDGNVRAWRFSDKPVSVEIVRKGRDIEKDFYEGLDANSLPLKEGGLMGAVKKAKQTLGIRVQGAPSLAGTAHQQLRELADLSLTHFNAQLFIIQRADSDEAG